MWQEMGNGWQWFWLMALMCAMWLVVVVGAFFVRLGVERSQAR